MRQAIFFQKVTQRQGFAASSLNQALSLATHAKSPMGLYYTTLQQTNFRQSYS